MKKIFWFSGLRFSDSGECSNGTWIGAMGRNLAKTGRYKLYNIALCTGNANLLFEETCGIKQWVLPKIKIGKNGLPPKSQVDLIVGIVDKVSPDLIHVWGMESFFGLIVLRYLSKYPNLLDIQGIKHIIGRFFNGYMTIEERFRAIGFVELIRRHWLSSDQRAFFQRERIEKEMIAGFNNISYQSRYVLDILKQNNYHGRLRPTGIALRSEFLTTSPWNLSDLGNGPVRILVTASSIVPYKGLSVVVEAVAKLKNAGVLDSDFRLRIAGNTGVGKRFTNGYASFLRRLIRRLDMESNCDFLGFIDAEQLVREMHNANVYVCPSYTETYSLSAAEALAIGVPSVLSYAGALPELAVDRESALFFPPGDVSSCAARIAELVKDGDLSSRLSVKSVTDARLRNDEKKVLEIQEGIYRDILGTV